MKLKHTLMASASALVLLGAASSGAFAADQLQENISTVTTSDPTVFTVNQAVSAGSVNDDGSRRVNSVTSGFSDNFVGISHDQQNNGNNNAIGVATNVLLNTSDPTDTESDFGDVTQNLYVRGATSSATYTDDAPTSDDAIRSNSITNAYKDVQGIVDVQQNNGDGNVMGVGDVVSANLGSGLGQNGDQHDDSTQKVRVSATVTGITARDTNLYNGSANGERNNAISNNAFDNFLGLASVQQNNGNGNVIQAGNAVVADLFTGTNTSAGEAVDQSVKADASVTNNKTTSSSQAGASPQPADRDNRITGVFDNAKGIVNVQQNNGDGNAMNVANSVRASYETADDIDSVNSSAVAAIGTVSGNTATDTDQNRVNTLQSGSFADSAGLMTVQQNNGDNNAMNSATGVTASIFTGNQIDGASVTAGASATASVTNNKATATDDVDRQNTISSGSFNGAVGVATVQQNNGDNNVINASKSIVAGIGDEGTFVGFDGEMVANTSLTATVSGNTATIAATNSPPGYANVLTASFDGFQGIKTVQQNNGNNNALQSTITVVGNVITN